MVFVFIWFWILGCLSQQLAALPRFQKSTGLSVLSFQRVYLTQILDMYLSPHRSSRALLITLSLDTVEDVMVGEVDELEEDVG